MLDRFTPATQDWFRGAFDAPTNAQAGAWEAISAGRNALVVAPTGSGKTLSAFLWAIDSVFRERVEGAEADGEPRTRILYISPLKALGVDVERNLRSPLIGIAAVWIVSALIAVAVGIVAPLDQRVGWLCVGLGITLIVAFAVQIFSAPAQGFIGRMGASMLGALVVMGLVSAGFGLAALSGL